MSTTQTFRGLSSLEKGDKVHKLGTTASNAGSPVDVVTHTVNVSKVLKLTRINVSCSKAGLYEIFENAVRIGVLRTSAAQKSEELTFEPVKDVAAGVVIKVTFTQASGSSADVEALIQGSEV